MKSLSSKKIGAKQRKFFLLLVTACIGVGFLLVSFTSDGKEETPPKPANGDEASFNVVSQEVDSKTVRLSALETLNDTLQSKIASLERTLEELHEQTAESETDQDKLADETRALSEKLKALEE